MNTPPKVPTPVNEPVLSYAPGTRERAELKQTLKDMGGRQIEIPVVVGGKEIRAVATQWFRVPQGQVAPGSFTQIRLTTAWTGSAFPSRSTAHATILYVCGWSYVQNVRVHVVDVAPGDPSVAGTFVYVGRYRPVSPPPQPTAPQKYSTCSRFSTTTQTCETPG